MTETMLPTYNARIRFKTYVRVDAGAVPGHVTGAGLAEEWVRRDMTSLIIDTLDASNPTAICGVQWRDLYSALERVGDVCVTP